MITHQIHPTKTMRMTLRPLLALVLTLAIGAMSPVIAAKSGPGNGSNTTGGGAEVATFVNGWTDADGKYHSGYYLLPTQSPALVAPDAAKAKPVIPYGSESYVPTPGKYRSTSNNIGNHVPTAMPNMTYGQVMR